MVFTYLAEYMREMIKNIIDYYKEKPQPIFKKPDAYKNINTSSL